MSKYRYIRRNPFTRKSKGKVVRKKTGYKSLTKRVKKLEIENKKQVEIHDTAQVGEDMFTTPQVTDISPALAAGTNAHFLSFQLRGMIQVDVEDVDVNHLCRVCLVLDRNNQDPATDPTWLDVWLTNDVFTLRNYDVGDTDAQHRFRVLFDKTYYVSKVSNGFNKEKVIVNCYKKLDLTATYGTGNHASKNGLWLLFMSTGATGDIDFAYQTRLRYTQDV